MKTMTLEELERKIRRHDGWLERRGLRRQEKKEGIRPLWTSENGLLAIAEPDLEDKETRERILRGAVEPRWTCYVTLDEYPSSKNFIERSGDTPQEAVKKAQIAYDRELAIFRSERFSKGLLADCKDEPDYAELERIIYALRGARGQLEALYGKSQDQRERDEYNMHLALALDGLAKRLYDFKSDLLFIAPKRTL